MILNFFGLQKYNNFFIIQHLYKKILNFFENLPSEATCAHSEELRIDPFATHILPPKVQICVRLFYYLPRTGNNPLRHQSVPLRLYLDRGVPREVK